VGITVAGQLTPDKELTHIGLVIPIHEALKSVRIESKTAMNSGLPRTSKKEVSCSA
jgi:hypothetical protein